MALTPDAGGAGLGLDVPLNEFVGIRHNRFDPGRAREMEERSRDRYRAVARRDRIRAIRSNLRDWEAAQHGDFASASLDRIRTSASEGSPFVDAGVVASLTQYVRSRVVSGESCRIFLQGGHDSGKTFVARAILREFVRLGVSSLHETTMVTETELTNTLGSGFAGRARVEEMMRRLREQDKSLCVEDIDVLSRRGGAYTEAEQSAWSTLVYVVEDRIHYAVLTSEVPLPVIAAALGDSMEAKLGSLFPPEGRFSLAPNCARNSSNANSDGGGGLLGISDLMEDW